MTEFKPYADKRGYTDTSWPDRIKRYRDQGCWAIMPDGTVCVRSRKTSKEWDGPGSVDGRIALCAGHATRFIKYGNPRTDIFLNLQLGMTFEQRVEHYMNPANKYVTIQNLGYYTPCIIWERSRIQRGYGIVSSRVVNEACGKAENYRSNMLVHRMMWIYHNGLIEDGEEVDHLCHKKPCCNINHLELKSRSVHRADTRMHSVIIFEKNLRIAELEKELAEIKLRTSTNAKKKTA